MRCPQCPREELITLELDEVEVDYCVECRGVWLDAGELDLLLGEHIEVLALAKDADAPRRSTKPRRCPECRRKMPEQSFPGAHPVVFEMCPNGDGLWLDHGELETLIAHGYESPRGAAVAALLREMFHRSK